MACLSRACPYPAATLSVTLLCHLGPLLHFKKSASGCCQPPPAGGPPTADLSNCTRRAGRRCLAPPGPARCRGPQGICPLPGPGVTRTPAGPAAQWQLSCSRPSALRAARNQRRAAVAGRGPRANPSHRTGDGRLRARPRQTDLAGVLPIHRLRCQTRQLRWSVSVA
jgi:hypothetical protein